MALLYSLIGRNSLSTLRGHSLNKLSQQILKGSSAVFINRQPFHHQLLPVNSTKYNVLPKDKIQLSSILTSVATRSHSSAGGHNHGALWTFERLLSLLLLPVVPAAFITPCQQLDTAMALLIVLHSHFGLEAIVVDYVRPILFGNVVPKIAKVSVYLFSMLVFSGLLNMIYNDAGIANTIITLMKK